ncbi:MAG: NADH pyrophosphatase, partial [Caulobacter sp. 35-67-4]
MALSIITNTFAGNPLDRSSERRGDASWLAEKLADAGSLAVAIWNGKPLVEDVLGEDGKPTGAQIAYLRADMAQ